MSVFNHLSYKDFVRNWVNSRPHQGRGEYRRIANHLGVSSTMVSQVFNGEKELNLELAAELTPFFGFTEKEERYFFLLVEFGRAGSKKLKDKLEKQILELQKEAQKVSERVAQDKELSPDEKAHFYSSWVYSGIRNLVAIPKDWTSAELASRLQISESLVRSVLEFLLDKGLLKLNDNRFEIAAKATHIGSDSPLVVKHHQNWRIRALQKMDLRDSSHLFYTGPMSLSKADAEKVRQMFLDLIQSTNKIVIESPSETIRCMNIDWFEY